MDYPEFPGHPEPHTMTWTPLESERIAEYGRQCFEVGRAQRAAPVSEAVVDTHLKFIERWAVHHAAKPHMTAEQTLGVIAHYPPIRKITESYVDENRPETFDPYAEIERLQGELAAQQSAQPVEVQPVAWRYLVFSLCDPKGEWTYSGKPDPSYEPLYKSAQPVALEPLTAKQVGVAARILAERFDYTWEHMPAQGRETMRSHVITTAAALGITTTSAKGAD